MNLQRPRSGRVIAGVCAGLARRFGWSPTVVRLLFVLSLLLPGPQVIIYIIMWIVIPNQPLPASAPGTPVTPTVV
jgi:phage shock protein PspC (stress-responsive transcriptional regulator)